MTSDERRRPEPKRPASTKPATGSAGGCSTSAPKKAGKARQSTSEPAAPGMLPPNCSPTGHTADELLNLALTRIGARLWVVEKSKNRAAIKADLQALIRDLARAEARLKQQDAADYPGAHAAAANVTAALEGLRAASDDLPHPRRRMAATIVMQIYCLLCEDLRHRPVKSDTSSDVQRMSKVLSDMGLPLSVEQVRNTLSKAERDVAQGAVLQSAIDFAADVRLFMVTQLNGVEWAVEGLPTPDIKGQIKT